MSHQEEWSPFRAWHHHSSKRNVAIPDIAVISFLCLLGGWFFFRAAQLPEYRWQWGLLAEFVARRQNGEFEAGLLLKGFFTTLRIGIWTIFFSLIMGSLIGMLSAKKSLITSLPCQIFINLVRNTPPLVLLFCVYFFAGNILPVTALEDFLRQQPKEISGLVSIIFAQPGQMDRMIAAILALGTYQSAYVAEIVRGGIQSVPAGQWDASLALGFSRLASLRFVILPQAARLILPPLTGQAISTFKDSALASLISLPDLTFQSLEIMAISGMTFEIWLTTAILYLFFGVICSALGSWAEKKYASFLA